MGRNPRDAEDPLLQAAYDELRRVAAAHLRRERSGHTLQPTALVHEAFLSLRGTPGLEARDEAHFRALASRAMRRVLVHHARRRDAKKRGGEALRITLHDRPAPDVLQPLELLGLHEALERLALLDARQARVVELRFFGGLDVEEVARALGVSKRSVEADWTLARAFLRRELEAGQDPRAPDG